MVFDLVRTAVTASAKARAVSLVCCNRVPPAQTLKTLFGLPVCSCLFVMHIETVRTLVDL